MTEVKITVPSKVMKGARKAAEELASKSPSPEREVLKEFFRSGVQDGAEWRLDLESFDPTGDKSQFLYQNLGRFVDDHARHAAPGLDQALGTEGGMRRLRQHFEAKKG